ncbi:MAG: hypothetical protein C4318_01235 [Acidimicrobiia bacterium]
MAGVSQPSRKAEGKTAEANAKRFALKTLSVLVMVGLVGYGAVRVASQKRAPSGSREASPLGPPAAPGLGEITATCIPRLDGPRGNVFSAALDLATPNQPWDPQALAAISERLTSYAGLTSPGFYVRIGFNADFSGSPSSPKPRGQGPDVLDWRFGLESGSTAPRLDDLVEFLRRVGAEPQIDVGYFARTPEEAGALVAFLNGVNGSDPAVQARIRAGRSDPPKVNLFELTYPPVPSISPQPVGIAYVREHASRLRDIARSMRSSSPTPIRLLVPVGRWQDVSEAAAFFGQLIGETKDFADGYSVSFAPDTASSLAESAKGLAKSLATLRRLMDEAGVGKDSIVAVAPWDMSSFGKGTPPTWRAAIVAAAGAMVSSAQGASLANYPGIPATVQDPAGYTFWPGADPNRPSPTYEAMATLASSVRRERLRTELTEAALPMSEETPTPKVHPPEASASELIAQCSRGEGVKNLVIVNLSSNPAVINVKVGFDPGERFTKTVLVAPLDSPLAERSRTEFLSRNWFSDTLAPYSITVWSFSGSAT